MFAQKQLANPTGDNPTGDTPKRRGLSGASVQPSIPWVGEQKLRNSFKCFLKQLKPFLNLLKPVQTLFKLG